MGALKIGRVGIDVDHKDARAIRQSNGSVVITGHIKEMSSLAEANAIRASLIGQEGSFIAVTYSTDPTIDGFYIVKSINIDIDSKLASLIGVGFMPYTISLEPIGEAMFESRLVGFELPNNHTLTPVGFLSPPFGYTASNPEYTFIARTGTDGILQVMGGVGELDNPIWTCPPANFYLGAVSLYLNGLIHAGTKIPIGKATSWKIDNTLMSVEHAGGADLRINHYDGSTWETAKDYDLLFDGGAIGNWDHLFVVRNDPEVVALHLVAGRAATGKGRYTLDIEVRRGSRFVTCYLTSSATGTLKVQRETLETGSTSGMSSAGVRAASNDGDGNRYVILCPNTHTPDTTQGGLSIAATKTLTFGIGLAVGGGGAQAGDGTADLVDQFHAIRTDTVIPTALEYVSA